jgi:phosphoglucosamine mutase
VLDKHTTGDGLVSALQILQTCVRSGRTMAELLSEVTLFPQTLFNVLLRPVQKLQVSLLLNQETQ